MEVEEDVLDGKCVREQMCLREDVSKEGRSLIERNVGSAIGNVTPVSSMLPKFMVSGTS